MFDHISVRAGNRALEIIREEGLNLNRVKVLAGASGAAKFLVLTGIDRVLMSLFKGRTAPLYLIGTSIGAFRMAAYCQKDPETAINNLEREYIAQYYPAKPSRQDITRESWRILNAYIDDGEIHGILNHPFMKITFLANRCRGLMKSENLFFQSLGILSAGMGNLIHRRTLGCFFERALFCAPECTPPFAGMNGFPFTRHTLSPDNFKTALLASGSIPFAMEGVTSISGSPGLFRDGGILDYHLDIPFLPEDNGLVLYPHFYEHIIPGWFDKNLKRKPDPENMKNVVLISPSRTFVESLPLGRIPDRKDFKIFFQKDAERIKLWQASAEKNRVLGEEFLEAMASGGIKAMVKPL
jgi:hypothetical protein